MDFLLFGAFPYVALVMFLVGTIARYKTGFKYSSLSSQFLETKKLFLSSVPFHVGILVVLLGHLIGFLFPSVFLSFGGQSLVTFEIVALSFAFAAIVGLISLFIRRATSERLRMVTNKMDVLIELLLMAQFIIGIWIAVELRWGSGWYASNMAPYLQSIWTLNPDVAAISVMPLLIQLHIVGAFLIVFLIPFTRLVHFLVMPLHYITRPHQLVTWYWDKKKIRDTNTPWTITEPKNN